jgi:prepilin-type N-terminal cleavage/methylation domain-containing protein
MRAPERRSARRAFTLVEVLASLMLIALVVPVAMEAMAVASRVGELGQRKAAAMRVGERVLGELLAEGQLATGATSGVAQEGPFEYPWSARLENWPEDALQQVTVTVTFSVRGTAQEIALATLLPATGTAENAVGGQG